MKKILAILCMLSLCIVPALAETAADAEEAVEETYQFIVPVIAEGGNIEAVLAMDADFAPALALLGEPVGYFESESCAFQGLDKVYTFPSFVVNTYPQEGVDCIQSIYLMDDTVTTAEGAYIGMHIDELAALYGEPGATAEGSVSFVKGGCALAFIHDADGYVTAITYTSIAASAQ